MGCGPVSGPSSLKHSTYRVPSCSVTGASALDDVDGQAAAGGLLVLVLHVRSGLPHGLDRLVQRHVVLAVTPDRHPGRGDRLDRGDGVPLYTRDLDQAADRVAGEAEVVLDADLRRVLHLLGRAD